MFFMILYILLSKNRETIAAQKSTCRIVSTSWWGAYVLTRVCLYVYARAYASLFVTPVGFRSVNRCWFAKLFPVALGDLENVCCLAYETFIVKMRLYTIFVLFLKWMAIFFLN